VATIGAGEPVFALRSDMDALPILVRGPWPAVCLVRIHARVSRTFFWPWHQRCGNCVAVTSVAATWCRRTLRPTRRHSGRPSRARWHACGHDTHMTMLLGGAPSAFKQRMTADHACNSPSLQANVCHGLHLMPLGSCHAWHAPYGVCEYMLGAIVAPSLISLLATPQLTTRDDPVLRRARSCAPAAGARGGGPPARHRAPAVPAGRGGRRRRRGDGGRGCAGRRRGRARHPRLAGAAVRHRGHARAEGPMQCV
jgi:hypothetical protein